MKILFTLTIISIITAIICGVMGMGWLIVTVVSILAFLSLVGYSEAQMSSRHSINLFNNNSGVKLTSFQRNVIRIVERRIPYLVLVFVGIIFVAFTWVFRISVVVCAIALIYLYIKY